MAKHWVRWVTPIENMAPTGLPDIELAVDPGELPWRNSNFITGVEAMPARFTPTEKVGTTA